MAAAVFAVAAMLVGLGTVGGLGGVSAGLGKSETLTGRTELWSVVVERGSVPTLTGQGFGTAWIDNSPVRVAVDARFPGIVSAHNIFLEWFIAVGVVGAVLVLLVVLDALRIAARSRVRQRFSSEALIAVATFVLVRGLAEAGFPNKNSSATILAFALMSTLRSAPRRSEAPS